MFQICLNLRSTIEGILAHLPAAVHILEGARACLENPSRPAGEVDLDPLVTLNASESKLNDPTFTLNTLTHMV